MRRLLKIVISCTVLLGCAAAGTFAGDTNVDGAAGANPVSAGLKIGDYVLLGKYYDEPVLWRCVDIDENGPLMLSDKVLCFKAFDAAGRVKSGSHGHRDDRLTMGSNYWGDSNIRSWLNSAAEAGKVYWLCGNPPKTKEQDINYGNYNGYIAEKGFLADGNFTQTERNAIKQVTQKSLLDPADAALATSGDKAAWKGFRLGMVDPDENRYEEICAENVTDKVFLLDIKQLWRVCQNSDILGDYRLAHPTQEALDHDKFFTFPPLLTEGTMLSTEDTRFSTEDTLTCWLRTPVGIAQQYSRDGWDAADRVMRSSFYGDYAASDYVGVRPAFYLDTDNAEILSGSGTAEDPYVLDGKKKDGISVYCNGWELAFDQPPVVENDRVLVPMRAIFEALGAQVSWDGGTQTVTATKGDTVITLQIGRQSMIKNGKIIVLDTAAKLVGDRTLVPVRAVSEGLGASVAWNEEENTVEIVAE